MHNVIMQIKPHSSLTCRTTYEW